MFFPLYGKLTALPNLLAGFQGHCEEKKERGKGREGGKSKGKKKTEEIEENTASPEKFLVMALYVSGGGCVASRQPSPMTFLQKSGGGLSLIIYKLSILSLFAL